MNPITIRIKLFCQVCQQPLDAISGTDGDMHISPCKTCGDKAYKKGRKDVQDKYSKYGKPLVAVDTIDGWINDLEHRACGHCGSYVVPFEAIEYLKTRVSECCKETPHDDDTPR